MKNLSLPSKKTILAAVILLSLSFIGGFTYATTFFQQVLPASNFTPGNPFNFCGNLVAIQSSTPNYVFYHCASSINPANTNATDPAFFVNSNTRAIPSFNITGTGFDSLSLAVNPIKPSCNPSTPLVSGTSIALSSGGTSYYYCGHYTSGAQFGALTITWGT